MLHLNYNGSIIKTDKAIINADNRGFRYGDGLFETMRMKDGVIPLADLHFERLMNGLQVLEFERPSFLTPAFFTKQIVELAKKNNHQKQVRVRLMVFRGDGGLYDALIHAVNYIIQTWSLPDDFTGLNENGLVIDIFPDAKISSDKFSNLKSNNYLPYLMGALYVKKHQLNDCLLLNSDGNISDATIANVFMLKAGELLTPPLSDGCVAGVMRKHLLVKLAAQNFYVKEKSITVKDLLNAEEVFLSNAIYGIRWVKEFRAVHYKQQHISRIFNSIIREIF